MAYILIFKFFLVAHSAATIDHFNAQVLGPIPMDETSLTFIKQLEGQLDPKGFVVRAWPTGIGMREGNSPMGAAETSAGFYQLWLRYGDDAVTHMNDTLPTFHCISDIFQRREYGLPEHLIACRR